MTRSLDHQDSLLAALFDRMPMGIAVLEPDLTLRRCNPTWAGFVERCSGVPAASIRPGARLADLIPDAESTTLARYRRVLAGETVREEGVIVESAGRVSYWDVALVPLLREGQVVGILDVTVDANERCRAQQALEEHHNQLEEIVAARTAALTAANRHLQLEIAERERAEAALRASEEKHRDMEVLQREIAERQRIETELRWRIAFEKLISGISSNFINLAPGEVDGGINQALRAIGELADVDRSYVFLFSDEHRTMSNTHEWCAPGIEPMREQLQAIPSEMLPWWTERLLRQEVIYIPRVADLPPEAAAERQILELQGIQSLVVVPLVYRNATVGFLGFDAVRAETRWTEESIAQLRLTGEIIVNALERKRSEEALILANQTLEQRVEERTSELTTLLDVQQAISSRLDPEAMLKLIADEVRRLTTASKAVVYLLEGDALRIAVLSGDLDPSLLGLRVPLEGSLAGLAIRTGKPQTTETVSFDQRVHQETASRAGTRHILAVPLIYGDRPIGVIALANKADGPFDQEDIRQLTTLAAGAAVDLENARLYHEEQERRQEAEQRRQVAEGLRDIVAILNSTRPLQEILDYIVAQAGRLMGTETGALLRLEEDGQTLVVQASRGLPPVSRGQATVEVGRGAVGRAVANRQPVTIHDWKATAPQDGLLAKMLGQHPELASRCRGILAVPVLYKDDVYGGIVLYYPEPRDFSEEEIALALAFADQAALAIENARLRARAEQLAVAAERSRLARDLHDAVTQTLFSASLIAEVLPRLRERNPREGRRRLEELRQLTRGALAEMRSLLLELRPTAVTEAVLGDLVKQLAEALTGRARVPVAVTVEGQRGLPPEVQVAFYRIAQEALNNVAKHAAARHVEISLHCLSERVELSVSDDGRGFAVGEVTPDHLGLGIMRERAEAVGASLTIASEPGRGTRVAVAWQDSVGR